MKRKDNFSGGFVSVIKPETTSRPGLGGRRVRTVSF